MPTSLRNFVRNAGHEHGRGKARIILPVEDGCVFVVSDQHYYPGLPASPAHKASLVLAKRLKPWAVIGNGDAVDASSISRWPVGSFNELHERPSVKQELDEVTIRLEEYERFKFVKFCVWNLGNHDARFETFLAERVPEYAGVDGFTLKSHFPGWLPAWTTFISRGKTPLVAIKHRYKGGEYSAYNNAMKSGISMVTGHDHKLWVKPISDYNGTRWGIDAGTISNIYSPHFVNYTEDRPVDWQSGFVILHFRNGELTGPELVWAMPNGKVYFRGDVVAI